VTEHGYVVVRIAKEVEVAQTSVVEGPPEPGHHESRFHMRVRTLIATLSLLLPTALSAQRIPLPVIPTKRGPGRAELPPQPEPIQRQLMMRRWRLSVESYPLVSFVQSPGMSPTRAFTSWATFGTGTRADYLLTRNLSATMDVTSSFLGGPVITNTAELGARMHPEWAEHKLYPFVDVRMAFVSAYDRRLGTADELYSYDALPDTRVVHYSNGFGGSVGVGVEYALTGRWSLTSVGSVLSSRMFGSGFDVNQGYSSQRFGLTSLRYMFGVRYNPIRIMRAPDMR